MAMEWARVLMIESYSFLDQEFACVCKRSRWTMDDILFGKVTASRLLS